MEIGRWRYKELLNSQPRLINLSCSDWFTQSRLTGHVPKSDLIWQMIALSVAKLNCFRQKAKFLSEESKKKKNRFCGKFGTIPTFRSTRKGKECFFEEHASV